MADLPTKRVSKPLGNTSEGYYARMGGDSYLKDKAGFSPLALPLPEFHSPVSPVGRLPLRKVGVQPTPTSLPQTLSPTPTSFPPVGSTGKIVRTTPSTQRGYEHFPEYSTRKPLPVSYAPGQDPKRQHYSQGTQSIMPNPTPPTKRKLKAKTTTDPYQGETSEPTVKPTPIPSDAEMDAAGSPSTGYQVPSLASPSGLAKGGTEAVAAYQRKLNSMGANLKVDGAWGAQTQAAFAQFQGKGTPTVPKVQKKEAITPAEAKANMEWAEQGKPKVKDYTKMDFLTSPTPKRKVSTQRQYVSGVNEADTRYKELGYDTTEALYEEGFREYPEFTTKSGITGRKLPDGRKVYPNGRISSPDGKGMMSATKLPRRKLTPAPEGPRLAMY